MAPEVHWRRLATLISRRQEVMTVLYSPDAEADSEGFVRTSDGKSGSVYVEHATQFALHHQCNRVIFSWESGHQSGRKAQTHQLSSQEPKQVSVPRIGRVAMQPQQEPRVNTSGVRWGVDSADHWWALENTNERRRLSVFSETLLHAIIFPKYNIVTCDLSSQPMQRSLLGNTSVTCNNTAGVPREPFPLLSGTRRVQTWIRIQVIRYQDTPGYACEQFQW
jgi:hypothetical protein